VWAGDAESDVLNQLVVTAGLDWRQVGILRAYRKYRQRIGSRFTEGYQNEVILGNPELTAQLMALFEKRFHPARDGGEEGARALRERIGEMLDAVVSLDHDRVLRNQLGLIEATVRTNAYKPGREALAFKVRSADVPAMPQPAPLYEIFVYSPEVEGVHLRGGWIARGGLRWSDRMDYRTEVFGLMRAQMTKNAVIVPDGAKGGFYLRRRPDDPAQLRRQVERAYVAFISGLLDLTDNRDGDRVVHPPGVRVRDDDDAYLVVAADKGTATFSDLANSVSASYEFWLGDAFASGGSAGYDHKALGITARGAWESLKRHFRESGRDPERDNFTVVGIGDMSGDVFGNGMLLSRTLKLVAAYDHRHVFIDPDPDPARSWEERKRLFELAGSSWADYDVSLLSEGGGVFPRTAKKVRLPEPARRALGIEEEVLAPNELISAILRAPVDVLWNGGIGTVVKASTESHDDAQDRGSDSIRVDADELRCGIVAEGGNLGLTQRARIEYARGGGRVNADFVDNSAGVNCSDHEVNLKVLLARAVQRGELTMPERDELLRAVTGDVVDHVLYGSFAQAQILSEEEHTSAGRLWAYDDLMDSLEEQGLLLRRDIEALPTGEDLAERSREGRGLERPELAVLVAYSKSWLTRELLEAPLVEDPLFAADLRSYFPPRVVERFGHLIEEHPLRRELAATLLANEVVDAMGATFVSRLTGERGRAPGRRGARVADRGRGHRRARPLERHRGSRPVRRRGGASRADGRRRVAGGGRHPPLPDRGRRHAAAGDHRARPGGLRAGRSPARGPRHGLVADRARGADGGAHRPGSARGTRPRARLPAGDGPRAGRDRGREGVRTARRGGRARVLHGRGPRGARVARAPDRDPPGQRADAALGAAGPARRRAAPPARPRPHRAGRDGRGRPGAGRPRRVLRDPRAALPAPRPLRADAGAGRRDGPRRPHARAAAGPRARRRLSRSAATRASPGAAPRDASGATARNASPMVFGASPASSSESVPPSPSIRSSSKAPSARAIPIRAGSPESLTAPLAPVTAMASSPLVPFTVTRSTWPSLVGAAGTPERLMSTCVTAVPDRSSTSKVSAPWKALDSSRSMPSRSIVMAPTSRVKRIRRPLGAIAKRSAAALPRKSMESVPPWPSAMSLPSPGSHRSESGSAPSNTSTRIASAPPPSRP
jgi:hypothetical protein